MFTSPRLLKVLSLWVALCLLSACNTHPGATPAQPTAIEPLASPAFTHKANSTQPPPAANPTRADPTAPVFTTQPEPAGMQGTAYPLPTSTQVSSPTPDTRLDPARWAEWPAIPTLSAHAIQIYQEGRAKGTDPKAFSRLGDCESVPALFLGFYVEEWAWLPEDYAYLQATIDHYHDSFARDNLTVKDGFGISSVLTPLMADPTVCANGETPLDCELRLHNPSLMFISMGTNWAPYAGPSFEKYLRQVVDILLEHGTLPIIMTKADNLELDNSINAAIAQVAYDYDLPVFNFWLLSRSLENFGLEDNGAHLTTQARDTRNFYGLMTLHSILTQVSSWEQP